MTGKEVRKLSDEEIEVELKRLTQKRFELRTQAVTEKIEDTSQFGKTRRDVARLLSERNRRRQATISTKTPASLRAMRETSRSS